MKELQKFFKKNKFKLLIYFSLFLILLGIGNTRIYYADLAPFGVAIVFALFFVKFNGYALSIIYFLSNMFIGSSSQIWGFSLIVSLGIVFIQFFFTFKNKVISKGQTFLFCGISYLLFFAINFTTQKESLSLVVSIILGMLFLYSCITFLDATFNRRLMNRLNIDEKIAGGVILIIFTMGLSCVYVGNINIGLVLVSFLILIATYTLTSSMLFVVSILMGLSFSVTSLDLIYVSIFLILAITSLSFKCNYKVFSGIALIGGYVITHIIFGLGLTLFESLSVVIGVVLFVFVPINSLSTISEYFDIKSQVIVKNIVNNSKKQIVNRVGQLAKVFEEMNIVYRNMVRGVLSEDKAIQVLKEELIATVCNTCPNKDDCFRRSGSFIDHSLDVLLSTAYAKGKVLLVDLPAALSGNCIKVNDLINSLNNLITAYKDYAGSITNLDISRVLIADQLYGVSKLLSSLSGEVDLNINFDGRFENRIKEDLSYRNVICLESAIYEKDIDTKIVSLIIKTDTIREKEIEKIVSKIVGVKLMISSIEESDISGASVVNMCVRPNYDIVFGTSVVGKTGGKVCGDNHSIVKIDEGKYMVSICDGMGSGKNANRISSLSINLIENFYKAGFDNDIILSSVNKLLSLTEEENFSTIDLCVIDCKKNVYDFIKLGATIGYIKRHNGDVESIKSSGLPVGMLEEISPHITKRLISPFDILIFMSDGVADSFEGKINFENYLYNLDIVNPQTLSDEIINKALELNQNIAKDDMTVVCVRVFEWV